MGHFLYRTFDAERRLLYVGISQRWQARLQRHSSTSPWYQYVEDLTVHYYRDRPSARAAELRALETEAPLWNKDGNTSGGSAVKAYDLERWQKGHRQLMEFYDGKPFPGPLEGEKKAASLAEQECRFEERLEHDMRIWRLMRRLSVLPGEVIADDRAS